MNPKVIMVCQCKFILDEICTILVSDNGVGYAYVEAGHIWEITVPPS